MMLDWNLENWAKFWQDTEYDSAMQMKRDEFYDADSCLGDSSACDHDCDNCSVGFEDGLDDWEDEDWENKL